MSDDCTTVELTVKEVETFHGEYSGCGTHTFDLTLRMSFLNLKLLHEHIGELVEAGGKLPEPKPVDPEKEHEEFLTRHFGPAPTDPDPDDPNWEGQRV